MKRLILLLPLLLQVTFLFAQQFPIPSKYSGLMSPDIQSGYPGILPGTIRWYSWNQDYWSPQKTVTVTYNSNGQPVSEVHDWIEGTDLRYTYSYDAGNRLTEELTQARENGLWVNQSRLTFEYDDKGNQTLRLNESYISGVWMIRSGYKTDREYRDERVYRETVSLFNEYDGSFYYFWRFTYTYQDGTQTGYVNETFADGVWSGYFRAFLYYDSQNRPDYSLFDKWNGTAWITDAMERYYYNGEQNNTLVLYQFYPETGVYIPTKRYTSEYDDHRNQTLSTTESWQNGNWSTDDGTRFSIAYEDGHAVSRVTETWVAAEGDNPAGWHNFTREEFSDFQSSGLKDPLAVFTELKYYPNPAGDHLLVTWQPDGPVTGSLELIDLTGKILLRSLLDNSIGPVRVDMDGIPPGLYKLVFRDQSHRPEIVSVVVQ